MASEEHGSTTELDSHADTCVVGANALILRDHGRPVSVTGYDAAKGATTHPTVDAAIAYDDPTSGQTRIFVVNQAIHIPQIQHNLLCPMQMRLNDVQVDEQPKFLAKTPSDRTHAITVTSDHPDDTESETFTIPLSLRGVTSYFPSRKPTLLEYERATVEHELTYAEPEWDPTDPHYERQEAAMTDAEGRLAEATPRPRHRICSIRKTREHIEPNPLAVALNEHRFDHREDSRFVTQVDTQRSSPIDEATLAKRWGIGVKAARATIKKTTQRGTRSVLHPSLSRRFRTNDRQLRYRRLPIELYGDTFFSNTVSRRGNTCAEVFYARNGWKRAFPLSSKSNAHFALSELFARDGVPAALIIDGSKEQTAGEFRRKAREASCHVKTTEPHSPWQNAAETGIKELKRGVGRKMISSGCPKQLWDDCLELEALIQSSTASNIYGNDGEAPETIISGETTDISQFCEHAWFDWIYFRDTTTPFPEDKLVLGRYLGPSIDIGPAMTAKLLKANGKVVHRTTYRGLTPSETVSESEVAKRKAFDESIKVALGESMKAEDLAAEDAETPSYDPYEDDDQTPQSMTDADDVTPEEGDLYIKASVVLPRGDSEASGTVIRRKREADGTLRGTKHSNPILDTRVYDVEFADGEIAEYSANVIAENMWAQCDLEGRQQVLFDSIVDFRKTAEAIGDTDRYVLVRGRRHVRKTTKGWKLCVRWRDGSTSWERLADLKESYPIEVSEFAVAQGIAQEPAFAWWVHQTLRRRNRVLAAVNSRYHKTTHKFGIRVPKSVAEAKQLDQENGNTLWMDAIALELANVKIAFKILGTEEEVPPGHQQIEGHIIFDVKMENFRRKARFVAGGHRTEAPKTLTYASVVSRESVRIALTIAALNDLEVKVSDIQNAYLTAPVSEKIWTILGPEWGADAGKKALIVRALYGLKSSGASFRNHLADCMRTMGFTSSLADPDIWYKAAVRPDDGKEYYSYVLLYVDDCMVIHHDAERVIQEIDRFFPMKKGSIGDPNIYLGAKLKQARLPNGVKAWGMSSSKYIQEAVRNVESHLEKKGMRLARRATTPLPANYAPEADETEVLGAEDANYFQSQIGILRWMVEIGRVDIITEVSALSSHLAMPREGHMEAVYHCYAYLKKRHNARMIFDPTYPEIDETQFLKCNWKDFYGDVREALPPNAPRPLGKEVDLRLFVDSSHADDRKTRRSRTGYFIYMNMAPIAWLSKKQATIETSVFGAEFVAMKVGMEALRGLRYKLRMLGIPISGPSYIYGDNMSVIHNTQRPESTLNKKSNSICYHAIREAVAMGECRTAHISTHENVADLATKILPGGQKRNGLVARVIYDIADQE